MLILNLLYIFYQEPFIISFTKTTSFPKYQVQSTLVFVMYVHVWLTKQIKLELKRRED